MGLSTFMLTAFLVVMTSAGWPGWPTGDNPFAGYHSPMFKPIRPFKMKSVFDSFENFHNFDDFPKFPEIKPIDFDMIKTYQPGNGENFQGHSIISNSYSSNNNGEISQGGHIAVVQNNNGEVKEEKIVF
uniref:Seroin transcript 1A3 n=1 Tax=Spodoptera frugiperda TaxID=7108 RepID=A0A455LAV3_SPOFR|nr:seroin transcript 1A3 [Spodoptera frugiperda]